MHLRLPTLIPRCGPLATLVALLAAGLNVSAESAPAESIVLTGKILDPGGQPVAGAVVELFEPALGRPYRPDPLVLQDRVTAAADGGYTMRAARGGQLLMAHADPWAPVWAHVNPRPGLSQDLTLATPATLAGVVVDEAGQPVAAAEVCARIVLIESPLDGGRRRLSRLTGNVARDRFTTRTDAGGRFRLTGLPAAAAIQLDVLAPGKALRPPGPHASLGADALPFQSGQDDVRLVVEPAGRIEGRLVFTGDAGPRPIARLLLQSEQSGHPSLPDNATHLESRPDGSFTLEDVAAGEYRLRAAFVEAQPPEWVADTVPVAVLSGQTTRDVRLSVTRGGLLEWTFNHPESQEPVAGVYVHAVFEGDAVTAASGPDGRAILRLVPGEHQVTASKPGWINAETVATIVAGETNHIDLPLALQPRITGRAWFPDGQPAAGLPVRLLSPVVIDDTSEVTDAEGRFTVSTLWNMPGWSDVPRVLLVHDPARNLAVAAEINDPADPLDLVLAPAVTLVGRAASEGQPINHPHVTLQFRSDNRSLTLTGLTRAATEPGVFEIPALPAGYWYDLLVGAPGYGQTRITLGELAAENDRLELEPIDLKPANLSLAGQVLDADDQPVAGAPVHLGGEGQPSANTRSDADGRFRFEQVCEGPAMLHASSRQAYGSLLAEGGDTNVVLRLGDTISFSSGATPHRLKGTVTSPDGQPLDDVHVTVFPRSGASRWDRTDPQGAFNLTWRLEPWQLQSGGSPLLVGRDPNRHLAGAVDIPDDTPELNLELAPALTLTGRVENPDGQPLAGAQVGVWLLASRTYSEVEPQPATTNDEGRFTIATLPPGLDYRVFARAQNHGRSQQSLPAVDPGELEIELEPFVLKPADQTLAGQVLDERDRPVAGVHVSLSAQDQPEGSVTTDRQGRFEFKVCEGPVRLFASGPGGFSQATAQAGDTNVVILLRRTGSAEPVAPRRPALTGKPLPDLAPLGLDPGVIPAGQPRLVCLFDAEQRPSRRVVRMLDEQHASLAARGLVVLAVQAVVITDQAFDEWRAASPLQLTVGRLNAPAPHLRWLTDVEVLPWLILTDPAGIVLAEGFPYDELETHLAAFPPSTPQ